MAGGGPTTHFRGQKVPAVVVAGRKVPSHVYATAIYGLTAFGIWYSMSGKPKATLEPKIDSSNSDESSFIREYVFCRADAAPGGWQQALDDYAVIHLHWHLCSRATQKKSEPLTRTAGDAERALIRS